MKPHLTEISASQTDWVASSDVLKVLQKETEHLKSQSRCLTWLDHIIFPFISFLSEWAIGPLYGTNQQNNSKKLSKYFCVCNGIGLFYIIGAIIITAYLLEFVSVVRWSFRLIFFIFIMQIKG